MTADFAKMQEIFLAAVERHRPEDWGGYLDDQLYPRYPVFIDGRMDLYTATIADEYAQVVQLAPDWRTILASHGVRIVLMPPSSPLAVALAAEPGWQRAYADPTAVVFVYAG